MRSNYISVYKNLDRRLTGWMARNGLLLLRISLGLIFFWFGILKFFPGISSAESIAARTIDMLTLGLIPARLSVLLLAIWECIIGIGLLIRRGMRVTLLLLFVQMLGTITPLFIFPGETFVITPWVPTLEGQYIIKNIVLISAGIVLGATVRGGKLTAEPSES